MDEKQIIKQLQGLRQIKPNKEWVFLTKQSILEDDQQLPSIGFSFAFKPIFALGAIVLVLLGIGFAGAVFMFKGQRAAIISSEKLQDILAQVSFQNGHSQQLNLSLDKIQKSLEEVRTSLEALEKTKNHREALAITGVIKATAQKSVETISQIQNSNQLSKKVLASLNNITDTSKELEQKSEIIKNTLLDSLIAELKQKGLSQEDQERLTTAEQYYRAGKTEEAMILIMRIGNK